MIFWYTEEKLFQVRKMFHSPQVRKISDEQSTWGTQVCLWDWFSGNGDGSPGKPLMATRPTHWAIYKKIQ
jgi:hypothetical protein